jgi:hypothetical protein
MSLDLTILKIIPAQDLILHEEPDAVRSEQLIEKLLQHEFLRNPPLVMPMNIDGAFSLSCIQPVFRSRTRRKWFLPSIRDHSLHSSTARSSHQLSITGIIQLPTYIHQAGKPGPLDSGANPKPKYPPLFRIDSFV